MGAIKEWAHNYLEYQGLLEDAGSILEEPFQQYYFNNIDLKLYNLYFCSDTTELDETIKFDTEYIALCYSLSNDLATAIELDQETGEALEILLDSRDYDSALGLLGEYLD